MADQEHRPDDRERVEITPEDVGELNLGKLIDDDYKEIVAANEALKAKGGLHTRRAVSMWVEPGSKSHIRPDADEVHVILWEDADIIIPWPEGMTPKEAILRWAAEQLTR